MFRSSYSSALAMADSAVQFAAQRLLLTTESFTDKVFTSQLTHLGAIQGMLLVIYMPIVTVPALLSGTGLLDYNMVRVLEFDKGRSYWRLLNLPIV